MASRKQQPPAPYAKQISTPLPSPQIDTAVNQVQIPENVMWLSGSLGVKKRYGSLPVASHSMAPNSSFSTIGGIPAMLHAYSGPSWLGANRKGVLSLMWSSDAAFNGWSGCGVFDLQPVEVIGEYSNFAEIQQPSSLSRGVARDDSHYYFSYYGGSVADVGIPSEPSSVVLAGELAFPYRDSDRPQYPVVSVAPTGSNRLSYGQPYHSLDFFSLSGNAVYVYGTSDISEGSPSAIPSEAGVFVGGVGGAPMHFDGLSVYYPGACNLSYRSQGVFATAAGGLTGTFQYYVVHVVKLPSGEELEGEPSSSESAVLAAQQTVFSAAPNTVFMDAVSDTTSLLETNERVYRLGTFSTTTAAGPGVVNITFSVVKGTNTPKVGDTVYFFNLATGISQSSSILALPASDTLTVQLSSAISGTTYFCLGGFLRLYRTKAGGDTFYRLRDTPYGVTPANDNTADSSLTIEYAPTATLRSPPPANSWALVEHQERLCIISTATAAVGQKLFDPIANTVSYYSVSVPTLWFSSALSKFHFDPDNTVSFTVRPGEVPTGLCSVGDTLYVFFSSSIYSIIGALSDATTYTVNLITDALGCISSDSIVEISGSIFFMSSRGLQELRGSTLSAEVGWPVRRLFSARNGVTRIAYWRTENLLLVSGDEVRQIRPNSIGVRSGFRVSSEPRTYVYSFEANKWAVWNISILHGCTEYDGDLLVWAPPQVGPLTNMFKMGAYDAQLLRLSAKCNWTDSGKPFTARYFSEWYDAGIPSVDKSFDRAQIFSTDTREAGGQGFKLTVRTERDWQPGLTVDKFEDITDFKVDTGYAEQPYDSQPYGDPELSQKVLPLSNQRCKSLRLVVENSEPNRNFAINGVAVEVSPKFVNMKDE
jgi:hypothetical protein